MARLIALSAAVLLTIAAATPLSAEGGRLGGGAALDVSLTRVLSAFLLCAMLAAVIALLLKRAGGRIDIGGLRALGRRPAPRRIAVIEARRISQHADICLLRCDGRDYLILSSHTTQTVLREADAAREALS